MVRETGDLFREQPAFRSFHGIPTTVTDRPFPWPRVSPLAPPPEYARLRRERPVALATFAGGQRAWLITRHADFRQVLTDPRMSSEHSHPGFPPVFPVARRRTDRGEPPKLTYSGMDRPDHAVHRRMVSGDFAARRIAELRPVVQRIVDERVQAMLDGSAPADLVRMVAEPVPASVIAELLGVAPADRPALQELSRIVLSHHGSPDRIRTASAELRTLVAGLVAAKEQGTQAGLLRRLVRRYQAAGTYDRAQLVEFVGALVTAGHETTATMISLGVVTLLLHPGEWARLAADPATVGPAIEELLRYLSVADLVTARVAVADTVVDGVTIRAGDGLVALGAAANHDPVAFPRPSVFDVRRGAGHHVAFGHGIHRCLGEHLARLELDVVLGTLARRAPGLRLAAAVGELPARVATVLPGLARLPVTW
jgi:cytochrome P450